MMEKTLAKQTLEWYTKCWNSSLVATCYQINMTEKTLAIQAQ